MSQKQQLIPATDAKQTKLQTLQLTPATNLDDIYKTLVPAPLMTKQELAAFYREEMNAVRGGDRIGRMKRGLDRAHGVTFYKTFFMGHPGVGKSTEMTRLSFHVADKFRTIRFSAQTDLDAAGFKPFDVLLVMMIKLVEETHVLVSSGELRGELSKGLITDIERWFETEKVTRTATKSTGVSASAGIKPTPVSTALSGLLGLFAEIKGEMKYTADRKAEITEYRLNTISTLIDLLNRLLDDANRLLTEAKGQEWLFVGEDFDKPGIKTDLVEALFISYANIFPDLKTHLVFNIPVALAYSEKVTSLTLPSPCIIFDTPVYNQDHTPNEQGRAAVEEVLKHRVDLTLFEKDQMTRLVVASGGNLRDLFEMTATASDYAADRNSQTIGERDVSQAITQKRVEYVNSMGSGPYDPQTITYEEKAARLIQIYNNEPSSDVADPILHSLLRARAVQEFNGERWFGIHPLVVDTLIRQHRLKPEAGKNVPGGSI